MPVAALKKEESIGNFSTLENFVAVKRDVHNFEERTEGGLLKPEIAQDKPQWATVVAVSELEKELHVGDRVFISKYTPADIEPIPGENVIVIHKTLVYLKPKRRVQ